MSHKFLVSLLVVVGSFSSSLSSAEEDKNPTEVTEKIAKKKKTKAEGKKADGAIAPDKTGAKAPPSDAPKSFAKVTKEKALENCKTAHPNQSAAELESCAKYVLEHQEK